MIQNTHVSVILPFYDEEDCAQRVIEELHGELVLIGEPFEIVAVQNGSSDKTGEILAGMQRTMPALQVVTVPVNQGFGYGIRKGLETARGTYVGWMPGDGQVPPSAIAPLLKKMKADGSAMGQGCRAIRHDSNNRLFISRCFNLWTRLMFGLQTKDINGEPKIMSMSLYKMMELRSPDSFIDAEVLLKAKRLGAGLTCVDIVSRERVGGFSKVHSSTVVEFILNLLKARFSTDDPWGINEMPKGRAVVGNKESLNT